MNSFDTSTQDRPTIDKSPGSTLNYTFGWSDWLEDGDSVSADAVVVSAGLTLVSKARAPNGDVTILVSGGTRGALEWARCTITTAAALIEAKTMFFQVGL